MRRGLIPAIACALPLTAIAAPTAAQAGSDDVKNVDVKIEVTGTTVTDWAYSTREPQLETWSEGSGTQTIGYHLKPQRFRITTPPKILERLGASIVMAPLTPEKKPRATARRQARLLFHQPPGCGGELGPCTGNEPTTVDWPLDCKPVKKVNLDWEISSRDKGTALTFDADTIATPSWTNCPQNDLDLVQPGSFSWKGAVKKMAGLKKGRKLTFKQDHVLGSLNGRITEDRCPSLGGNKGTQECRTSAVIVEVTRVR